jgi:hypothetical protein
MAMEWMNCLEIAHSLETTTILFGKKNRNKKFYYRLHSYIHKI